MTNVGIVSAICLSIVAALCIVAIFCRNYHENWLQFAGLAGLSLWASARVTQLLDLFDGRMPNQGLVLHVSLALYAVGTAWKVWQHNRPQTPAPPPAPYKLDPEHLHRVAGGRK
jgi:hypothetical protein